jgi:hypothetical protein
MSVAFRPRGKSCGGRPGEPAAGIPLAGIPGGDDPVAGRRTRPLYSARYLLPQQLSRPNFVSLLSMPDIGLSVISVTPVS